MKKIKTYSLEPIQFHFHHRDSESSEWDEIERVTPSKFSYFLSVLISSVVIYSFGPIQTIPFSSQRWRFSMFFLAIALAALSSLRDNAKKHSSTLLCAIWQK